LGEERACRLSVETIGHIRGLAKSVAGYGDAGDDISLGRSRAQEVGAAGVAVAGAAVADRRVLREAHIAGADRIDCGDRVLPSIEIADPRPARPIDRLLTP
jgi:hypothetical protein